MFVRLSKCSDQNSPIILECSFSSHMVGVFINFSKEKIILRTIVMRFAEIIDAVGKRLHVGCVMAAGQDWVEVSLPEHTALGAGLQVRFLPSQVAHEVRPGWRGRDRVGFTYAGGGPPAEQFAGLPGLLDPRPASLKIRPNGPV